ncbi:hypothetical protein RND81_09G117600 [Saponaria officinalis]|uniref:Uncharacterized protein n=1 Tax=Saponaria officinalis TaxID=3572 RepID=A0AAW1ILR7_SAPOF
MGRKSEASTLHKRKRQNPTPCPKQAPVEGGSSSFDEARAVNTKPQRFITVELPDDLPTDEEIRQQAPDERIALCLQMKRNAELLLRLNLQTMNALKIELQKNGHRNSEALAAIDGMISKFEEILAAARALPSFNIGTRNSSDKEIPGEGPPVNEVKTVARDFPPDNRIQCHRFMVEIYKYVMFFVIVSSVNGNGGSGYQGAHSFSSLLKQILSVLKFPEPVFYFLDETKNNVYVSVKAETEHISYVYVGGESENIADSCEKASKTAVKDLIKKFGVRVKDITSARKSMLGKCANLYNLKRLELERTEKGLEKVCVNEPLQREYDTSGTVCVEYMSILRKIFRTVKINCTPIETVETLPGVYVSWLTLTPSEKVVQSRCIFSDERPNPVAAKENLAQKVILYLVPLYNLEIVDANYDVAETKYGEVLCALERESYLTVKERVLGIKEAIEPSILLVEQDCITPRADVYRIPAINCPPLPPKKRYSRETKVGSSSANAYQADTLEHFSIPPELDTVFKRTKNM